MSWLMPYVPIPDVINPGYDTPSNYQIRIHSNRGPSLVGNLPEQFELAVGSTWDQPFSKSATDILTPQALQSRIGESKIAQLVGKSGIDLKQAVQSATGFTTSSKWLSVSVWVEGTNMALTLPMEFRAFNDPVTDVTDKIVQLMRMCSPATTQAGTLEAPGPTITGLAKDSVNSSSMFDGELITVELGNFVRLSPVIIEQVSTAIDSRFDMNGSPIAAVVNVSIKTPFVITKEDLVEMFVQNSQKGTGGR